MKARKTIEEINNRIKKGDALVLTAEEMIDFVEDKGEEKAFAEVDVVTTGTFGAMCSSGAFFNFGNTQPPIRMSSVFMNDVLAYSGLAAVDVFLGATQVAEDNKDYGGAHVIEDLLNGKDVYLQAGSSGTDCYPRREVNTYVNLNDFNQAYLYNPRNGYQNYNVAVNASKKSIYTYMGILLPDFYNATYSSAGQLSPLLNDPYYKTIGIGTKIFLGGAQGYISWEGTQHNPQVNRAKNGIPETGAGTIAVTGNLKEMKPEYIRAANIKNYGISLYVGMGIPIPIIDLDMVRYTAVKDRDIYTCVVDYSSSGAESFYGKVNYEQLKSGKITIRGGREIKTAPLSSYKMARVIAEELKNNILDGDFTITKPVKKLSCTGSLKSLKIRKRGDKK